ncbi:head maturation protease [Cellulophaga phage Ingeline_1]|uniref:S49 family peptidase /major capsid protein n=1 Tax=Cellulophaga phage Ingeline_1 TaxID=2745674 RepID=A0A8E4ZJB7_9CAUD|nr:head maturation protease [Cellulophaga phage Ingeline_1]QQV90044.1 S49 family peptidase /major capsid protein [Cellulophaga phage Ingeline_2]QQV90094.1 S49 family peptidase /major capsid protein [Cellulophaga phage Ingeline_3]QQV90144.1 S49 family peptidase /major capsid protein [Cellulophaga phage Ingeline_4]QQV90193.1 S49 family peptidase /major capsid protein [Cellulophaga phage Ingeline_5]QQV90243.1 S49 family peptidase /major capsid protein [Cellulophaga phage Ingeline_6]QQV90293.1 S4
MVAPTMANKYIHSANLILKATSHLNNLRIEAGFVREVVDADGNMVRNDQEVPEGSVGIVSQVGSMYKYGSWYNWGSDELVGFAKSFDDDPNIIGQVWRDDSGGGTISSVAPWLDFLANKKKPVVSLIDTCGSANYYKNCGTDYLLAENNVSSMIGSIGVMIQINDYSKMLKETGIVEHVIESDLSEDKNKAFKLALKGDYDLIKKEYLNPSAIAFQDYVKLARKKLMVETPGIVSGKMFYAEEAKQIGLIDGVGNLQAAIEKVKLLAAARSFINQY